MEFKSKIKTIEWVDTYSKMVDQTVVPYEYKFVNITTGEDMFNAIRNMIVRGAPAIGIAGAHGVILFAQENGKSGTVKVDEKIAKLRAKINCQDKDVSNNSSHETKPKIMYNALKLKNQCQQEK